MKAATCSVETVPLEDLCGTFGEILVGAGLVLRVVLPVGLRGFQAWC